MTNRAGEQGKIPARRGRLLQKQGYWYYTTREGVDIGPFDSRQDAEAGVADFIDFIGGADPEVVETLENCAA